MVSAFSLILFCFSSEQDKEEWIKVNLISVFIFHFLVASVCVHKCADVVLCTCSHQVKVT